MPQLTQRQIEAGSFILPLLLFGIYVGWMFGIEPTITAWLEERLSFTVRNLPEPLAIAYGLGANVLVPVVFCLGLGAFVYFKWLIPSRTKLANEQISKLADARRAMITATAYLELFESDLRSKSAQAERLREEVLSLQALNSENVQDLERKLKAMESLKRSRIWFERTASFVTGVASSLAATYFVYFMKGL